MWKRKIKKCLALGLAFAMMTGVAGCGKEQHLEAEINPDIPVSEVQFPLKEQAELSLSQVLRQPLRRIRTSGLFLRDSKTDECTY